MLMVLEQGVNRLVPLRIRSSKGRNGKKRWLLSDVLFSTVRETAWQMRFRRTLLNRMPQESTVVAALLCNPPLPWE